jgi:hypothetical protein
MPRQKSLFAQISKGDLVTIHDNAGERSQTEAAPCCVQLDLVNLLLPNNW